MFKLKVDLNTVKRQQSLTGTGHIGFLSCRTLEQTFQVETAILHPQNQADCSVVF